jgi:hypothetical protein
MLTGVGGLTSFGQAAFVGLGAYTTAYLTTVHGVSPWLTLPAGLLVTAVVALLARPRDAAPVRSLPAAGDDRLGDQPLLSVRQPRGARRPHRNQRHSAACSSSTWSSSPARVLLLIWAVLLLARSRHAQPARLARGARHPRLAGGSVMAEAMGVNTAAREDRHLHRRRPLRQCLGLALRAPAALRQSDALLADARHRIPVHGGGRRCRACLGGDRRRRPDHHSQAMAAGLVAEAARAERQLRDDRFRLLMIFVLHRARDGVWPMCSAKFPQPVARRGRSRPAPLARRTACRKSQVRDAARGAGREQAFWRPGGQRHG